MTDIEVKRKELETAKKILKQENCGGVGCPLSSTGNECPFYVEGDGCSVNGFVFGKVDAEAINSFIATREAELAELDKKEPGESERREAFDKLKESVKSPAPTVDDFALALIQGGYFEIVLGEDAAIDRLISRATKIRNALEAESDRRRS